MGLCTNICPFSEAYSVIDVTTIGFIIGIKIGFSVLPPLEPGFSWIVILGELLTSVQR